MRYIVFSLLFMVQLLAASAQSDIDEIIRQHHADVNRADQARLAAVTKSRVKAITLLERQASAAYSRKDRNTETAAWRAILTLDRKHQKSRQYFADIGILDAELSKLPNPTIRTPLPGKWVTKYATRKDTLAFTVTSDGKVEIQHKNRPAGKYTLNMKDGSAVVVIPHSDVAERWTLVGDRVLVESWHPRKAFA